MTEKTFEENLKELEGIAQELESGNLTLEESIKKFEIGMKLSKECTEKLDSAERKINMLVKNEDGEYSEEEFINSEE